MPDPWEPLTDGRILGYTPREPMDLQSVKPEKGIELTSLHAAFLDDSVLVVSDLHLGLEAVLHMQGVGVPKWQRGVMVPRLDALLRHYNPERVVVNGDFKHNFSRNLGQEWREAAQVLRMLREQAAVTLVKGNHDNYIESMAQSAGVPVQPRVELERFTLVHGHEEVDSDRRIVVGHEHPAIMLRDEVGARVRMPCFLVGPEVIALPAFSPLSSGTDVTSTVTGRGEHFTPVFEGVDADSLRVFAVGEGEVLDFRTLGELRSIRGL
ncbi:MAG: metallophosphoesterase [Halobacteriales archaeon]|nr:metallophosphoesterase [Halobacteriales archaeon]